MRLQAPWTDAQLRRRVPAPHAIRSTADGFTAEWQVLHLARNFPGRRSTPARSRASRLAEADFGVSLLAPVDAYRMTERAVKYQLLFLGLTATLFFLLELLARLRVHPVQYLLIGLGLVPVLPAAAVAVRARRVHLGLCRRRPRRSPGW